MEESEKKTNNNNNQITFGWSKCWLCRFICENSKEMIIFPFEEIAQQ